MCRLFLFFSFFFAHFLFASCPHPAWDQTVTLERVNDGDTVTLSNGRLVRFIGINTPEINYSSLSHSEPLAVEAKALLTRYIKKGDKLHLLFDKIKVDRYGRILAYVYSQTGQNLSLLQLQTGFAQHWVIGKNDRFWSCFQNAERLARLRKKGIWSDFKPLKAAKLKKDDKGYAYISGHISSISKNSKGLQFFLDKKLKVQISSAKLKIFKKNNVNFLQHDKLLLTGKLIFRRGKPKLMLYHPAQILP